VYSGEKPEKLKKNLTFENGGKNLEQQSAEVALRCVALRCVALRCVALRCVALRCVALRA
jgi:hypothetical protein